MRFVGGSPTEQIFLIYSCLVIRFSLSMIILWFLLYPDHLIVLLVFIGRIMLILMIFIALILCLPAIQRVLLYLVVVLPALILRVALLSLILPGGGPRALSPHGHPPFTGWQLIYLVTPALFLTWHRVQVVFMQGLGQQVLRGCVSSPMLLPPSLLLRCHYYCL